MLWVLKEPSHRDDFFECPQHMYWLRNKDNYFHLGSLIWRPVATLNKERNPVFELLKCIALLSNEHCYIDVRYVTNRYIHIIKQWERIKKSLRAPVNTHKCAT